MLEQQSLSGSLYQHFLCTQTPHYSIKYCQKALGHTQKHPILHSIGPLYQGLVQSPAPKHTVRYNRQMVLTKRTHGFGWGSLAISGHTFVQYVANLVCHYRSLAINRHALAGYIGVSCNRQTFPYSGKVISREVSCNQ